MGALRPHLWEKNMKWKQLFCRHIWVLALYQLIGEDIKYVKQCSNCGKERLVRVDDW